MTLPVMCPASGASSLGQWMLTQCWHCGNALPKPKDHDQVGLCPKCLVKLR